MQAGQNGVSLEHWSLGRGFGTGEMYLGPQWLSLKSGLGRCFFC